MDENLAEDESSRNRSIWDRFLQIRGTTVVVPLGQFRPLCPKSHTGTGVLTVIRRTPDGWIRERWVEVEPTNPSTLDQMYKESVHRFTLSLAFMDEASSVLRTRRFRH